MSSSRIQKSILPASDQRYREIMEYAPDAILTTGIDGMIEDWNKKASELFGWKASEVKGKKLDEIILSPLSFFIPEPGKNDNRNFEGAAVKKNGEEFFGEFTISSFGSGPDRLSVIIVRDISERKKAERKTSRSGHFIRHVTEHIPYFINVYDIRSSTLIYKNKSILEHLGYVEEAKSNDHILFFQTIVHPDDIEPLKNDFGKYPVLKKDEILENEFRVKRSDGHYLFICVRASVFERSPGGEVLQVLIVSQDVTDQKEANRKIFLNEALLAETQKIVHLGSWENDTGAGTTRWTDEMYRLLGYEPFEINVTPSTFLEHVHPADQLFVSEKINAGFKSETETFECRIIDKRNKIVWLQVALKFQKGKDGHSGKMSGTALNISSLKESSEELRRRESLYKALAHNMPDSAVLLLDKDLRIMLADGKIWNETYLPKDAIINHSVREVLSPAMAETYIPLYLDALKGQETEMEVEMGPRHYKVSIVGVKNEGGEIFACIAVTHDITELKKYQKELERRIEELNRSNLELEQFAYIASHDLQEPLRKIRSFADVLVRKYYNQVGEDGKIYFERMNSSAERMQSLIEDLLTFSRFSRTQPEFFPVDMNEEIRSALIDLEVSIEARNAQVNVMVSNREMIEGNPSQIRQLFQNLISNSLKFTKKGVRPVINIDVRKIPGSSLPENFDSDRRSEYVQIKVRDNGIGFDEKYSDKIFQLFQRLHGRSEFEGTGIGLAVCKKIVENHNGFIAVRSREGAGTTFNAFIPVKRKQIDK